MGSSGSSAGSRRERYFASGRSSCSAWWTMVRAGRILFPGQGRRFLPLVARAHVSEPLPEVALEFLNGPSQSACWPMNRVMSLIGSASGCKFRLADPSVAPFHCGLLRTPLGLWVVDLLAPDGIGVNDALVRYALLADNDVLRVGRYRIRIRSRFASRDQSSHSASDLRIFLPAPGAPRGDSSGPAFPGDEACHPRFPGSQPSDVDRAGDQKPDNATVRRSGFEHRLGLTGSQ